MALCELEPQSYGFEFGGARLCLRYDMAALLRLEKLGYGYEDIFAAEISRKGVTAYLKAGLTEDIGGERVQGIIDVMGGAVVWEHCRAAMLLALPKHDPLIIPDTRNKTADSGVDFGRLRTLVCDVMGKPEAFFWESTIRELMDRWQQYAVVKGYAKEPERMRMFDDEGDGQ